MKFNAKLLPLAVSAFAITSLSSVCFDGAASVAEASEVNVYSYRQPFLVEPLFAKFTEKTGIKVNTIFAKKGLIERVELEGENSPADVLLTVDISRLKKAVDAGVTQSVDSDVLDNAIPANYRGSDDQWFALTLRARVIYASNDRVSQDAITYEELADPKWKGKLCTRSGQHSYSLGLFSSVVEHRGEESAKEWLEGVKNNLARAPSGNDRAQVKSIFSGECDIALGNTYYMGLMQTNEDKPEQKQWAESVKVLFPTFAGKGTHVNVSGMVMLKHAPHPEAAMKLMEFLVSDEAQKIYAEVNHEYPVKEGIEASERVQSWGKLVADDLPIETIAKNRGTASKLVDEVGFNDGPSS